MLPKVLQAAPKQLPTSSEVHYIFHIHLMCSIGDDHLLQYTWKDMLFNRVWIRHSLEMSTKFWDVSPFFSKALLTLPEVIKTDQIQMGTNLFH